MDNLHASRQTIESISRPSYWRAICPHLTVSDAPDRVGVPLAVDPATLQGFREDMLRDGFFLLGPEFTGLAHGEYDGRTAADLAAAVRNLIQHGWNPLFLSVYNETWALASFLSEVIRVTTGGNELTMDFLSWYVDPSAGQAGFAPHRDRQPKDIPSSFRDDGTAKYTTCWVALTDATPHNSCLYAVPRAADPGYLSGDHQCNPLDAVLGQPGGFQQIRALPRPAGSAVVFTHRLIHWGSAGNPCAGVEPRIALAFASSSSDFEEPYFSRDHLPLPSVVLRVALCCAQGIEYNKRLNLSKHELALFNRVFTANSADFCQPYRRKIASEYSWSKFVATSEAQQNHSRRRRSPPSCGHITAPDRVHASCSYDSASLDGIGALFDEDDNNTGAPIIDADIH